MLAILCAFGWHKAVLLGSSTYLRKQGCDRCGKQRLVMVSQYGRRRGATKWA